MDRRIKRLGIGALAALLMVAMLVAPAAAAAVSCYTLGPDSGGAPDSGCKDENGDLLFSLGTPETSDWGYYAKAGPNEVPDPLNLSNPPYYIGGDDVIMLGGPSTHIHINDGFMGNGSFYTGIGEDIPGGTKVFARLFNCWESETPTYYGDSIVVTTTGLDPEVFELPNWNTTIEIEWPGETFEKDLESGWNLVSLPLMPEDNSTSAVLNSINTKYDAVMKYTPGTGFEDADTMDPEIGYFINITDAAGATWTYEGEAYEQMTADLSAGLNCVGWVNETDSALPGALNSIAGNYNYVAQWNAGTQSYEVFVAGAPDEFNDFDTIERGEGYFIAATTSCTLTYP